AVLQREVAHAADLVGRLTVLDAALADTGVPARQGVEVAHPLPDPGGGGADDGGDEDTGHYLRPLSSSAGLSPAAFFTSLAMRVRSEASRIRPPCLVRLPPSMPISASRLSTSGA